MPKRMMVWRHCGENEIFIDCKIGSYLVEDYFLLEYIASISSLLCDAVSIDTTNSDLLFN